MKTQSTTNSKTSMLKKAYTNGEEIFNAVTHGVGTLLAITALVVLLVHSSRIEGITKSTRTLYYAACSIFASSLILLYLMSTLYHSLTPVKAKKVFAIFDHSSIYILIAGTYTPFCLIALHGVLGYVIFAVIWALAIAGISLYAVFGSRIKLLSAIMYVLMGWMIVFAIKPLKESLCTKSIVYLIIGGGIYTLGVIFYSLKKVKWMHCIWHFFVLGGSVFHFFSVYYALG